MYELILLNVTGCFCTVTVWHILELFPFHRHYQFWTILEIWLLIKTGREVPVCGSPQDTHEMVHCEASLSFRHACLCVVCVCVWVCVWCVFCYPESLSFQSVNIAPFDFVDKFTSDVFCLHIFTLGNSVWFLFSSASCLQVIPGDSPMCNWIGPP